jgi:putative Holliday junction resolvase
MRVKMRSLGLDIGDKRTGVAISDPQGILAVPLTIIADKDEDAAMANILKLVEQYEVERIVIGLPYSLDGSLNQQASKVTTFTKKLLATSRRSSLNHVDIQLWDERLSTVAADKLMAEAGTKRNKRKHHRDAIAAAFILQGFLDSLKEMPF